MMINDKKLYESLENRLRASYPAGMYIDIHAITVDLHNHETDERMYHAAVDIHEPGKTYHVWFDINDNGDIMLGTIERWFMG